MKHFFRIISVGFVVVATLAMPFQGVKAADEPKQVQITFDWNQESVQELSYQTDAGYLYIIPFILSDTLVGDEYIRVQGTLSGLAENVSDYMIGPIDGLDATSINTSATTNVFSFVLDANNAYSSLSNNATYKYRTYPIGFQIIGDNNIEGDETISIQFSVVETNLGGATIDVNNDTFHTTITDNDTLVEVGYHSLPTQVTLGETVDFPLEYTILDETSNDTQSRYSVESNDLTTFAVYDENYVLIENGVDSVIEKVVESVELGNTYDKYRVVLSSDYFVAGQTYNFGVTYTDNSGDTNTLYQAYTVLGDTQDIQETHFAFGPLYDSNALTLVDAVYDGGNVLANTGVDIKTIISLTNDTVTTTFAGTDVAVLYTTADTTMDVTNEVLYDADTHVYTVAVPNAPLTAGAKFFVMHHSGNTYNADGATIFARLSFGIVKPVLSDVATSATPGATVSFRLDDVGVTDATSTGIILPTNADLVLLKKSGSDYTRLSNDFIQVETTVDAVTSYGYKVTLPSDAGTYAIALLDANENTIYTQSADITVASQTISNGGGGVGGGGSPSSSNVPTTPSIDVKDATIDLIKNTVEVSLSATKNPTHVALSTHEKFTDASWIAYTTSTTWTFSSTTTGTVKLYAKFKNASGESSVVSDTFTITRPTQSVLGEKVVACELTPGHAYKYAGNAAVYYITKDCTKRPFNKEYKFFSFFTSWSDVETISQSALMQIADDALGFMPWGPRHDPKYGAIVKTVYDPKVYLLLNDEKYWITSPDVFKTLGYDWDWIEDVSEELLAKYTVGSEITYTDHHPNYTLVKYKNDSKVYRLEPDTTDSTKQVKRHIANPEAFNKLGFRWDRIVIIPDTEVYTTGSQLK